MCDTLVITTTTDRHAEGGETKKNHDVSKSHEKYYSIKGPKWYPFLNFYFSSQTPVEHD